jgi:hypothetical protein
VTRPLRCEECGNSYALAGLFVDGDLADPERVPRTRTVLVCERDASRLVNVVCPDCATVAHRFV